MFLQVYKGMGQISKTKSIQVQSPIKSFFSSVDLAWTLEVRHGVRHGAINIVYIAHAHVCEFLEGERGDVETPKKCNMHKNLHPHKRI
jgi:hypothetical protein